MQKILLPEQNRESDEFELFHETTKYDRFNINNFTKDIVRYLSDPITMYSASRNLKAFNNSKKILLPRANLPAKTLKQSLRSRVSGRSFSSSAMTLDLVSALLYEAVGGIRKNLDAKTGVKTVARAYPSGGGLYPIEIYLVLRRVEGLEPCIAHYSPHTHSLSIINSSIDDDYLKKILMIEDAQFCEAPLVVLFSSLAQRSTAKYGNRGYRFSLIESGHAAQNLSLSATALGLGSLAWGSYFDDEVGELICADGVSESVVHALLVGEQKEKPSSDSLLAEQFKLQDLVLSELLCAQDGLLKLDQSVVLGLACGSSLTNCLKRINVEPESELSFYRSNFVYVSSKPLDAYIAEQLVGLEAVLEDSQFPLGERLSRSKQLIVLELGGSEYSSYTSSQVQGVKHVYIDIREIDQDRLVHEVTHALCMSGNRFLDEGLAMLMQSLICGESGVKFLVGNLLGREVDDLRAYRDEVKVDILEFGRAGQILTEKSADAQVYARALKLAQVLNKIIGLDALFDLFDQMRAYKTDLNFVIKVQEVLSMLETIESESVAEHFIATPAEVENLIATTRLTPSESASLEQELAIRQASLDGSQDTAFLCVRLLGTLIRVKNLRGDAFDENVESQFNTVYMALDDFVRELPLVRLAYAQLLISKLFGMDGMEARQLSMEYAEQFAAALHGEFEHPSIYIDAALADYYTEKQNPEPNFASVKNLLEKAGADEQYRAESEKYLKAFGLI